MFCKLASLRSWPSMVTGAALQSEVLPRLLADERQRFVAAHPQSAAMAKAASAHWQGGVPLHWMGDWATPFVIFAKSGQGARLTDVDGLVYDDFCLADTPSMFGHGLEVVAKALADQASRGTGFTSAPSGAMRMGHWPCASKSATPISRAGCTAAWQWAWLPWAWHGPRKAPRARHGQAVGPPS